PRPADPVVAGQYLPARAGPGGCSVARPRRALARAAGRRAAAGRGLAAAAGWRDGLVEWSAADPRRLARKGRAGGLLDLLLHQLPADPALPARLGRQVPRARPGGAGR